MLSSSRSLAVSCVRRSPVLSLPQQQHRAYWQEIVRVVPDKQGNLKHEDVNRTTMRAVQGMGNDDDKREKKIRMNKRYEKPWMKRQRLKGARIYARKKQQVDDLIKYVHFKRDYRKKTRQEESGQTEE